MAAQLQALVTGAANGPLAPVPTKPASGKPTNPSAAKRSAGRPVAGNLDIAQEAFGQSLQPTKPKAAVPTFNDF